MLNWLGWGTSLARITQIMNLLLLVPDIQESILFLPPVDSGEDPVHLRNVQVITLVTNWKSQRHIWHNFTSKATG